MGINIVKHAYGRTGILGEKIAARKKDWIMILFLQYFLLNSSTSSSTMEM